MTSGDKKMDKLRIIIGDDSFASREEMAKDAIDNMFIGMADAANYKEAFPIRTEQEGNLYIGRNVVPYVGEIQVRAVPSVDELISEAEQGEYDLVVTDLQYGAFGGDRGGEKVVDALQGKQSLALCTSSYVVRDFGLGSRVNILASPRSEGYDRVNKFDFLGQKISQFYMKKDKA